MEFSYIGGYCSVCGVYDFLPIECDCCHKKFCSNHYSYASHSCKHAPKKLAMEDNVVSKEEVRRIKQKARRKKKRCCAKGCNREVVIGCDCSKCNLEFCAFHRLPFSHDCKGNHHHHNNNGSKKQSVGFKRTLNFINKHFFSDVRKEKPKMKRRKMNQNLVFQNTAENPYSSQLKYYNENRLVFGVIYPQESEFQPMFNYFENFWRVGKIIDNLCLDCRVYETDNVNLYNLHTGRKLNIHKRLSELIEDGEIKQNQILVLERNENDTITYDEVMKIKNNSNDKDILKICRVYENLIKNDNHKINTSIFKEIKC